MRRASELLKKHQWEMICRHYIEGMTLREIAAEMGVSHQYVTKGIKKGLHRIRCTYT
ncbi:MAG: sigma factor-like helix-turn-helix DNA-binding protein [Lachnospiraceae bacterium]